MREASATDGASADVGAKRPARKGLRAGFPPAVRAAKPGDMPSALRAAYDQLIASGKLSPDPPQAPALQALERVERDLRRPARRGLFRKAAPPPRGLYLWGPPGRGKSLLMDLFCRVAPEPRKRRAHFHVFMAEVHGLIRAWREGDAAVRRARFGRASGDDPIPPVADHVASGARLLCFDELQVTDIADAMLLGRLFEALFERGVVLVATSNRAPEDLYRDGINRQLFVPFIALITRRCEVVELTGGRDWRLDRLRAARAWFSLDAPGAREAFDALWCDLKGDQAEAAATLEVAGRQVVLARTDGTLARARFDELCERPLGPQDYLALAGRFHTVFLEDVPRLGPERREAARRFVTLIDALYEARARLVVLAEAEPEALYPEGDGAFEFERTVSRLQEMRSADYLARSPG